MYNQKFYKDFHKLLTEYKNASELINQLEKSGEVIVFGGAVRDYLECEYQYMPRDIDIVFHCNKNKVCLDTILSNYDCKKNRFGGYKIFVDNLEFDIWDIDNTWAYKENKVVCSESKYVETLPYTVFLNIDSIAYNLAKCEFIGHEYFFAKETNRLDIILDENPFVELNLLRSLIFKQKYNMILSENLIDRFIKSIFSNYNLVETLYELQFSHYKCEKIKKNSLKKELERILNSKLENSY